MVRNVGAEASDRLSDKAPFSARIDGTFVRRRPTRSRALSLVKYLSRRTTTLGPSSHWSNSRELPCVLWRHRRLSLSRRHAFPAVRQPRRPSGPRAAKAPRSRVWAPNARAVVGDRRLERLGRPRRSAARRAATRPASGRAAAAARATATPTSTASSRSGGQVLDKADPFAFCAEAPPPPRRALWTLDYDWGDGEWMRTRAARNALDAPMSIYEVHLGSWRREDGQLARTTASSRTRSPTTCASMGFTHVELMPITEHPFYGSWGYQTTGYFAPTARYGTPQDFMYFVDHLHQRGIGVILDWVPSHFPDRRARPRATSTARTSTSTPTRARASTRNGTRAIFNYGRNEVRSFLISSGAVLARPLPHRRPARGRGGLDALPRLRAQARRVDPEPPRRPREPRGGRLPARPQRGGVPRPSRTRMTIAEESTAWPQVSRPTYLGGLGFGMKWNMGWMHDTLAYFAARPDAPQATTTTSSPSALVYAFNENFVLPLSHDEVVHGKGSLIGKMPGDAWQQFANLRAAVRLHVGASRARSCCSWAASSASGASGRTRASSTGTCCELPAHAGVQRWVRRPEPPLPQRAGAARARLRARRLRVDRRRRRASRA